MTPKHDRARNAVLTPNFNFKLGKVLKALQKAVAAAVMLGASATASAGLFSNSKDVYIVQFNDQLPLGQTVSNLTGTVLGLVGLDNALFEYDTVLQGFAAALTPQQVRLLEGLPLIKSVEKDRVVQAGAVQNNPVWGLDRVDETDRPMDGEYAYADSAGAGVHVYIIDTGINPNHQEFTGRVGAGQNFVSSGPLDGLLGGLLGGLLPLDLLGGEVDPDNWEDCNGHGTHVAGTAAGTQYGVAKLATVHAVRVLNCAGSGTGSAVIAGIEWVAENAEYPAVVNLSLGGGASDAEDQAIANLFNANVLPVVAAGNDNADACSTSPARAPEAVTVASTASDDSESSFSNHGTCVDIYAPGSSIVSADYANNSGTANLSGTSMASPHVAGAAALILGETPSLNSADVAAALISNATVGKVARSPAGAGTPNLLLNTFPQGTKQ